MGSVLQLCEPTANNAGIPSSWSSVTGVISMRVTRTGGCRPGTLNAIVTYDSVRDNPQTVFTFRRFYPNLNIRVVQEQVDGVVSDSDRLYFSGRIDTAELKDTLRYGRVWEITARDWLGVLADHTVDEGKWVTANAAFAFSRGVLNPQEHTISDRYLPTYVGRYLANGAFHLQYGETRKWIIMDLCMNVAVGSDTNGTDTQNGIVGFTFSAGAPPNSKPIEWNGANTAHLGLLDAIRGLALSDPWWFSAGFAQVDGQDIYKYNTDLFGSQPVNDSGFGGELQALQQQVVSGGRNVEYYARGRYVSGAVYSYGNPSQNPGYVQITEYTFSHDVTDIYTKVRTTGKGSSQSAGPSEQLSTSVNSWDPLNGKFRLRREKTVRSQGLGGDYRFQDFPDELHAVQGRALRDQAVALYVSGLPGPTVTSSGMNKGKVTITGGPNVANQGVLRPGYVVYLELPALGLTTPGTNNTRFIVESWSWEWPSELTTIEVARSSMRELASQLSSLNADSGDQAASASDDFDTGWVQLNPSDMAGVPIQINHNLGVSPSGFAMEVGVWDMSQWDAFAQPVPDSRTIVHVQPMTQDPANGGATGYTIQGLTPTTLTVGLNHFIAYSGYLSNSPTSGWITRDSPSTVYRIRVQT